LPTPIGRDLGSEQVVVPDGDLVSDRVNDATHGTLGPYQVLMVTDGGEIRIDLYNHLAPITVENFLNLANAGYYDGMAFHTVEQGSAVFSGSKVDAFGGTAGYYIPSEYHPDAKHDVAGTISMVSKVVNAGSSEFVIALEPKADWDAYVGGEQKDCSDPEEICYAVFGKVIVGLDVLMGFEEIGRLSQSMEPHRILKVTVLDSTKG
jgi:cyclophilin family peptidyl-prolyl cis-trans isomerase